MRLCVIGLKSHETSVQSGLAVTPVDMDRMTAVGRAVSSHSLDNFLYHDGYKSPSDLPLPMRRGRDMNQNWEMVQQFKRKVNNAKQAKAMRVAERQLASEMAGKE